MARLTTLRSRLAGTGTAPRLAIDPRPTAHDRGYNYRWQKARKEFLANNPLCAFCARDGEITIASVVDHIEPHRGNQDLFWSPDNWQPLCKPHHDSEKQKMENGGKIP